VYAPIAAPGVTTLAVCTGELEIGGGLDGRVRAVVGGGGGGPPMSGGPPGMLGALVGCGGCGGPPRLGGMAELGIKRGLFGLPVGDEYLDDEAEPGVVIVPGV